MPKPISDTTKVFEVNIHRHQFHLISSDRQLNQQDELIKKIANTIKSQRDRNSYDTSPFRARILSWNAETNTVEYELLETGEKKSSVVADLIGTTVKVRNLTLNALQPKVERCWLSSLFRALLTLISAPFQTAKTKKTELLANLGRPLNQATLAATFDFAKELFRGTILAPIMEKASKNALEMQLLIGEPDKQEAFIERFIEEWGKVSNEPLVIPFGIGEGKNFVPHILVFNSLYERVTRYTFSAPTAEAKVVSEAEYKFANTNDLKLFLKDLFQILPRELPEQSVKAPEGKRLPLFDILPDLPDALKKLFNYQKVPTPEGPIYPNRTVDELLLNHATFVYNREDKAASFDPLKLIYSLASNHGIQRDEAFKSEFETKALFYRKVVEHLTNYLNNPDNRINDAQRGKILQVLSSNLKQLHHYLSQQYGEEVASHAIHSLEASVKRHLNPTEHVRVAEQANLDKLNTKAAPLDLTLDYVASHEEQLQKKAPPRVTQHLVEQLQHPLDPTMLDTLSRSTATPDDKAAALARFNQYVTEIDQLFNQGQFAPTKDRLLALMQVLPGPTALRHFENTFWDSLDGDESLQWFNALEKLSKLVWERAVKTWDVPLDPVMILEARVVLTTNMRKLYMLHQTHLEREFQRKHGYLGRLDAKERGQRAKELNLEPKYMPLLVYGVGGWAAKAAFKGTYNIVESNLYMKDYSLIFGSDPKLNERWLQCKHFFHELEKREEQSVGSHYYPSELMDFYAGYHGLAKVEFDSSLGEKLRQIHDGFGSDPNDPLFKFISPQLMQVMRHEQRFNMLEQIGREHYCPIVPFYSNAIDAMVGSFTNPNPQEKEWQAKVRATLTAMPRIDIALDTRWEKLFRMKPCYRLISAQSKSSLALPASGRDSGNWFNDGFSPEYIGDVPKRMVRKAVDVKHESVCYNFHHENANSYLDPVQEWKLEATALHLDNDTSGIRILDGSNQSESSRFRSLKWDVEYDMKMGTFSPTSIKASLEYILRYPKLINQPRVQHRLIQVCFHPYLMVRALASEPKFFERVGPLLQKVLEDVPIGDQATRLFLMDLCQRIRENASALAAISDSYAGYVPDRTFANQNKQETIYGIPAELLKDFGKHYANIDRALPKYPSKDVHNWFDLNKESADQKLFATYLLDFVQKPGQFPSTAQHYINALYAYYILQVSPAPGGHPFVQNKALKEASSRFNFSLGKMLAENEALRNQVLAGIAKRPTSRWVPVGDSLVIYTLADDNSVKVNLLTGEGFNVVILDASECQLPHSVLSCEDYAAIFGDYKPIAKAKVLNAGKDLEYTWQFKGVEYSVTLNPTEAGNRFRGIIYQIYNGEKYGYHEVRPKKDNLQILKLLKKYGTWRHSVHKEESYLAPLDNDLRRQRIRVYFNSSTVQEASMGEGADKLWVCQEPLRQYTSALGCFTRKSVLYLTGKDKKTLSAVVISEDMTLKRQKGDDWRDVKRPNWQWWQQATDELVETFGEDFRQFILPLRDVSAEGQGAKEFWIYPYSIQSTGKAGCRRTFIKPSDEEDTPQPLKLTWTQKEGYRGSHAAFLYMVYAAWKRGDLASAGQWLTQMMNNGKSDKNDIEELKRIIYLFKTSSPTTAAKNAFLLKLGLNLSILERELKGSHGLTDNFVDTTPLLPTYANRYVNDINNLTIKQRLLDKNLVIDQKEIDEFVRLFPGRAIGIEVNPPKLQKLGVQTPTIDDVAILVKGLEEFTLSKKVAKLQSLHELKGSYPKPETVLAHFWDIWSLIITDDTIHLKDCLFLFAPMTTDESLRSQEEHRHIYQAVDIARSMLILLLIKKEEKTRDSRFEQGDLKALRMGVNEFRNAYPAEAVVIDESNPVSFKAMLKLLSSNQEDLQNYLQAAESLLKKFVEVHSPKTPHLMHPNGSLSSGEKAKLTPSGGELSRIEITAARPKQARPFNYINKGVDLGALPPGANWTAYFTPEDISAQLEERRRVIATYLTGDDSPMETAKNAMLNQSVDKAFEKMNKQGHSLNANQLGQLESLIKERATALETEIAEYGNNILAFARQNATSLGIVHLFVSREPQEHELMHAILSMYVNMKWGQLADIEKTQRIEQQMTYYLLAVTEYQQLQKASVIQKKMAERAIKDPAFVNSVEWKLESIDLHRHLTEGSNRDRYTNSLEQGKKELDRRFDEITRAYLADEYLNHQISRKLAIEALEELFKGGNNKFVKLRMGLGKSTFIMRKAAMILQRRGVRPVVIFTEKLLKQSVGFMDPNAFVFNYDRRDGLDQKKPLSEDEQHQLEVTHLKQLKQTLVSVEAQGRYIITTPEKLAGLINKKAELDADLIVFKAKGLQKEMERTFEKLLHVQELLSHFKGVDRSFLVDEDVNLDISVEFNYSYGGDEDLDRVSIDMGDQIMQWLLINHIPTEQFLNLAAAREKVLNGQLTAIPSKDLPTIFRELVQFAASDKAFWLRVGFTSEQYQAIKNEIEPFINNPKVIPENISGLFAAKETDANLKKALQYLGNLKLYTSRTFDTIFNTHPDFQRVIKKSTGCVVIPGEDGVEKPNYQFGDTLELIGHHYLYYAVNPPSKDYFDRKIRELAATSPWDEWVKTLNGMNAYDKLAMKESFKERLQFCKYLLRDSGYVKHFRYQLICRQQDIYLGTPKLVLSGTGSAFAMNMARPGKEEELDVITGEMFLKEDFNAQVTVFRDIREDLQAVPGQPHKNAIINQAYAVGGNDSKTVIEELRKQNPGRQFIFVDTTSRDKKMWHVDKDTITEYHPGQVSKDQALYYYGPTDSRGIDFRIARRQLGNGQKMVAQIYVGSTTTLDDYNQAKGRMRELGFGQDIEIHIDQAMAERIKSWSGKEPHEIKEGHVVNDIKKRTLVNEAHQNPKAATYAISSIVRKHILPVLKVSGDKQAYIALIESYKDLYLEDRKQNWEEAFQASKTLNPIAFLERQYQNALDSAIKMWESALLNYAKLSGLDDIQCRVLALKGYLDRGTGNLPAELLQVYNAHKAVVSELDKELRELKALEPYYNKYLPKDNLEQDYGAKERQVKVMTQTQVQLQVQRKDRTQAGKYEDGRLPEPFKLAELIHPDWKDVKSHRPIHLDNPTDKGKSWAIPECVKRDMQYMRMSVQAGRLLGSINAPHIPSGYIVVVQSFGQYRFCVITAAEWSEMVAPSLEEKRLKPVAGERIGVYPLDPPQPGQALLMDLSSDAPKPDTKEFVLGCAKLRFMLGWTQLGQQEIELLKEWLKTMNPDVRKALRDDFVKRDFQESVVFIDNP